MTKGLNYKSEEISQLYNEIVEFITQHESLMLLPISSHSQREIGQCNYTCTEKLPKGITDHFVLSKACSTLQLKQKINRDERD